MMIQLELFEENKEKLIHKRMQTLEERHENLRKSLHSRVSMQQKRIKELECELEFLKAHICKGNLFI